MKYSVLAKRVVNVRIDNIEADSQTDAIKAIEDVPYHLLFPQREHPNIDLIAQHNPDGSLPSIRYIEDGEETAEYLVDEEGDEDFARSRWYASDGVSTPEWAKRQAEATATATPHVFRSARICWLTYS